MNAHGAAHYDEPVIGLERWQRFVPEEVGAGNGDVVPVSPGGYTTESFKGYMLYIVDVLMLYHVWLLLTGGGSSLDFGALAGILVGFFE